jgi:hypothetical protein
MISHPCTRRVARRPGVEPLESRTLLAVFTVTSTGDSGPGTLRQAILDADASQTTEADEIRFDLPGPGVHTIAPTSPLPAVTSLTTIDGATQPGYAGSPVIELDGSAAGAAADGLVVTDTTVRSLAIHSFAGNGIRARGARLEGNVIGLTPTGDAARPNGEAGVLVEFSNATIGGPLSRQRNVISGNAGPGIAFRSDYRTWQGGTVTGNYIGTDATGARAIPNGQEGILSVGNTVTIGGGAAGAGNVISGNAASGIRLVGASATIKGNLIGTSASGGAALGNGHSAADTNRNGITFERGQIIVPGPAVGGDWPSERNVISANHGAGVSVADSASTTVLKNLIGTDISGTSDLGNAGHGIILKGVTVWTAPTISGNLISGNGGDGLHVDRMLRAFVSGNYIGVDDTGTRPLGNDGDGIEVLNTPQFDISAGSSRPRSIVSANAGHGIRINAPSPSSHITGQFVGTDATGEVPMGNGGSGIYVMGEGHHIGSIFANGANLISANRGDGVTVEGSRGLLLGTVVANRIGVSLSGNTPGMGNGRHGVALVNASGYQVGRYSDETNAPGANVIAHNAAAGVVVVGDAAATNRMVGNLIHSNGGSEIDLGGDGVTPNDPADADTGPNRLLNFPVITAATVVGAGASPGTSVRFTLSAEPQTAYTAHFYSAPEPDATGYGGAAKYLGYARVTTDTAGNFVGTASLPPVSPAEFITATTTDDAGSTSEFGPAVRAVEPEVAGRFVFYNNSARDGGDPAANPADDAALAADKYPLFAPGGAAPQNITSYHKGINGVIIDIADLPAGAVLTADDFDFRSGNGSAAGWSSGPAPTSITLRRGAGIGGADRVTLVWPDYDPRNPNNPDDAVANGYLRVTVKATPDTGLTRPDTFYFGNLIGDTLAAAPRGRSAYRVDARDLAGLVGSLGSTNANAIAWYDHNGDGQVTARDFVIARSNLLRALSHDVQAPE